MGNDELDVVTGAFSHTGKYITRRLLSMGKRVRTLTGRPNRENPFGPQVNAFPFNFDKPSQLRESLQGATTLYNTYWIRFSRGEVTFDKAVKNTETLIKAAKETGAVVTAEEHTVLGGLGSAVAEVLVGSYPVPMQLVGIQDSFCECGSNVSASPARAHRSVSADAAPAINAVALAAIIKFFRIIIISPFFR